MHRFLRDLIFLGVGGVILFLLVPNWFGINVPIGGGSLPSSEALRSRIRLPDGFSISIFASEVPNVRVLHVTEAGDILVSLPKAGRVVLLEADSDGNGESDGRRDILTDLNRPHGIDLVGNWLYVAETDAIGRVHFDAKNGKTQGEFERIITGIPEGGNHWSRTVRFGPDGWMYVSIGSSCNVCEEKDPRRAAILRFKADGSGGEIFAGGLRNSVGFDWRPETNDLFAVDNGRDFLGDEFPPCELNRIERGRFYGWPYANGNRVTDPDLGRGHEQEIKNSVAPVHEFAAHSAPLSIKFLRNQKASSIYRDAALVALHGSWNRSEKIGYRIVSLHFDDQGSVIQRPFISGFEVNGDVIGRPVDIAEGRHGAIYLTDDYTGTVYRVDYNDPLE